MSTVQEERSAETRKRLLDATIECLHELGYAGTTTPEIARRAGVSRGAQLHHYRRKEELVVGALEYVFELRLERFSQVAGELPADPEERVKALVDLLWPQFKGPTFYAWLELVVASRSDAALREAVRAASNRFMQGVHEVFKILFGITGDAGYTEPLEIIIFGMLEALALERILCTSEQDEHEKLEPSLRLIKVIAGALAGRRRAVPEEV
jgi:AcrR family transcriptional regulator